MNTLTQRLLALPLLLAAGCGAVEQDEVGSESLEVQNCPAGETCVPDPGDAEPTILLSLGTPTANKIPVTWKETFAYERKHELFRRIEKSNDCAGGITPTS